jgi:pyruvate/2-oxoglutarate dehydrogenase complex dihydrolipoamide acyltransferase (E2) component
LSTEIVMPFLSESMESGVIVTWLKSVGDHVDVGEDLVEIDADKAQMTYQSDTAGVLIEIVVPQDVEVPTGGVIARIEEDLPIPACVTSRRPAWDRAGERPRFAAPSSQCPFR